MTLGAKNLSLARNGRAILDGVSASFETGQFTAILGPNGAGKSTLISCLAGLLAPNSGNAMLGGQDIATMPPRERAKAIGLLPQSAETRWAIRAEALVALGRYPHQRGWGASPADRAAIDAAMTLTDTRAFAERPVTQLSGGERARVLMARVLAGEPSYILADEPLANLDPGHQIDMLNLLRSEADRGRGVVAVLHDLGSAARFADHVVLLHQGRVFAKGSPRNVLNADSLRIVYGIEADIGTDRDGKPTIAVRARSPQS